VARGLLAVASAVVGEDFLRTGRTLEAFGLARLNGPQMTELLQEGL
jgi:opine dehydrogenase